MYLLPVPDWSREVTSSLAAFAAQYISPTSVVALDPLDLSQTRTAGPGVVEKRISDQKDNDSIISFTQTHFLDF
jgi:hypothetical protein